ncbi:hypothetical protein HZQ27_07760 [Elizabethkingia anophelis]|nr:hypothetical protein [Elizabethkingia anophelis]
MSSQSNSENNSFIADVLSIDSIIKASYEVVSGEKGAKRQWQRDKFLHHPKAVYSFTDRSGEKQEQVVMSIGEFQHETDEMVLETAFYEKEINREVRIFGNIAHVWSTYETQLEKNGPVVRRGINSVQLFFENNRWYIISWIFDKEQDSNRIPKTFDRN